MIALLLFVGSFLLYLITLNGTIPAYRDSGDLINAITTLGIAHPPGYPLYVVVGKLFQIAVPFANPAYGVNLLSAVSAAASAALLYRVALTGLSQRTKLTTPWGLSPTSDVVRRWDRAKTASFIAVVLFVLSPAVLMLGRVAEMYTLAGLFGAGLLACYVWDTPQSQLLGCFLLGCGFGVHPTLLVFIPLFVPWKTTYKEALLRLGVFLIGFSVVLFPWVRSGTHPVQNWGNPNTLTGLWRLITRSNYGGLKLHPVESQFSWTFGDIGAQLANFFRSLKQEWNWLGLGAGLVGLAVSFKRSGRLVVCWLLAGPLFFILSNLPLTENTTGPILQPYLVLVNLIWAVWVAGGLFVLFQPSRATPWMGLLLAGLAVHYGADIRTQVDSFRQDFYAYDLGRNDLRTLPLKSVLYDPDDQIAFTLRSLQLLENRRNDVILLNFFRTLWGYQQIVQRTPDLLPPIPVNNSLELDHLLWTYSIHHRPFYVDLPMKVVPPVTADPDGLLYRVSPSPQPMTAQRLQRSENFWPLYVWRGTWRTTGHRDFFTQHIFNYRAASRCNIGLKFAERKDWAGARQRYQEALSVDPHLSAAYNDLGVIEYDQGHFQDAVRDYELALKYDPTVEGYRQNLELAKQAVHRP
jgi:hypothetical protein